MLRIDGDRLARRNPEKGRVEPVHLLQKAAEAAVHLPRRLRVRVVVRLQVPASRRHLANGIATFLEKLPEGGRVRCTGKRQLRPTTASGSALSRRAATSGAAAALPGSNREARCSVSLSSVGWSSTKVEESTTCSHDIALEAIAQVNRHQRVHAQLEEARSLGQRCWFKS